MSYFTNLDDLIGADFSIINPDCPWHYNDRAKAGNRGAECKYPVMKLADLCALPVPSIIAKDCACFMWATYPKIDEALLLMKAWGFTYKTAAFTWIKLDKAGKPKWGMGRWTRANAEVVLLGTRGRPLRVSAGVHSVVQTPFIAHSRKPDEVRQRIVKLMGDLPRLEMFARGDVEDGWERWGNQPEYTEKGHSSSGELATTTLFHLPTSLHKSDLPGDQPSP